MQLCLFLLQKSYKNNIVIPFYTTSKYLGNISGNIQDNADGFFAVGNTDGTCLQYVSELQRNLIYCYNCHFWDFPQTGIFRETQLESWLGIWAQGTSWK
jgi:hypothetical protein